MKGWILFIGFILILIGYQFKSAVIDFAGICLIAYGGLSKKKKK